MWAKLLFESITTCIAGQLKRTGARWLGAVCVSGHSCHKRDGRAVPQCQILSE